AGRWTLAHRGARGTFGLSLQEFLNCREAAWSAVPYPAPVSSLGMAIDAANGLILARSDFMVFTRGFIFLIFFSFLVPIWTLSFATEAIGGERESNGLIWLLTRPISRPAIYLAKFLAVLPWCLTLNVGGFALMCAAAGRPGP